PTKYDWTAYLTLVKLIQAAGLKVQASMCFHGCKYSNQKSAIALPSWVLKVGDSDPNIFFTDHSGNRYKDCLSLAIDDLPLFEDRSPLQLVSDMLKSFRATFSEYIGNTIVEICVGLGPDGELKYPSFPSDMWKFPGVGEFQCYDKHMLANLKQHSEEMGQPLWGLGGPHNAPSYCQFPQEGGFFTEDGGSWNSSYGDFFLSWYTSQLLNHGDRMLSLAASIFRDDKVV
ncbi:glycosyl hydrolase family protein, partial [Soehngenia saccharolytica]